MKIKQVNCIAILLCAVLTASARDSIVYFDGPSFSIPAEGRQIGLDVNADGTQDFIFLSPGTLTTDGLLDPDFSTPYYFGPTGTNQILTDSYGNVTIQSFGVLLGTNPPSGQTWTTPPYFPALLTAYTATVNGTNVNSYWYGPLGMLGEGYLGVKFQAADGTHFGWIRVRLPDTAPGPEGLPLEFAPVAVDWAYETRTNAPIPAGVIDPSGESIQFILDLHNRFGQPQSIVQSPDSGSFILTGDTLRCEVSLAGAFSSLDVYDSATFRSRRGRPVLVLDQPLVAGPNLTSFLDDVVLSREQRDQLLRGEYYLSTDDGKVLGRIVPLRTDRR
jgi:hypothetical protein